MLLLFETPAGYALFKVKDNKLKDNVWEDFQTADRAAEIVKLKAFSAFENTTEAVVAATSIVEGKLDKGLKKFLKKQIVSKELQEELAVADLKTGGLIKDNLDIQCVHNDTVNEIFRGIRGQMQALVGGEEGDGLKQMQLGLSHSLSRYKLKFTADKVDIMIVQAIGLLDDLDKEINTYAMRVREWYGWHYPEMSKVVNDNKWYALIVLRMGFRMNCKNCDFSDILGDETMEETLKKTAETSMGTEISDADLTNIQALATEVIALSNYRVELYEYLKNRMQAIAPNLTVMVGELVGARLIAHAGSLLNLDKHPASTIQILGAEKALFRALKTKHDTPKYGLIYHASLIGQTAPKNKGKISRVLAAKTALSVRVDALGDSAEATIAVGSRVKVEARMRQLEGVPNAPKSAASSSGPAKYDAQAAKALAPSNYNPASDMIMDDDSSKKSKKDKKRSRDEDDEPEEKKKKSKKEKREEPEEEEQEEKKSKKEKKEKKDKKDKK